MIANAANSPSSSLGGVEAVILRETDTNDFVKALSKDEIRIRLDELARGSGGGGLPLPSMGEGFSSSVSAKLISAGKKKPAKPRSDIITKVKSVSQKERKGFRNYSK